MKSTHKLLFFFINGPRDGEVFTCEITDIGLTENPNWFPEYRIVQRGHLVGIYERVSDLLIWRGKK